MCRKKLRMANVHRARRPLKQKWPPNRGFIATGETTITEQGSSAPMSEKMTQHETE
ncbi:hypothetical protein OOU_Y34scaffold00014g2 [Pyricularia oryzae Y34]|uniref:Uncharacterized protein n=1 Tax=Pyricularia oryzae (strain Y34) TaxID=1143189 RepID=A0AA97PSA4_PYRO3|nr:hypothetical protein OOU_Y34scaffold00014g2 [Pyricularia oryzae Y34]